MLRGLTLGAALVALSSIPAFASTLDGRIVSLDSDLRQLTLETGETLNLTDTVSMDQLAIDQIVHVTCTDGTTDAISVEVTQDPPPVTTADVSTDDTTSQGATDTTGDTSATTTATDTTTSDSSVTTTDTTATQTDTSTVTDQGTADNTTVTDQQSTQQ